jgi:predicted Zn-dependent peptidase
MLHKVEEDLEEAYSNPTVLAHELLHKAAFTGGLSNALLPDPANLYSLSGDVLREYVASAFTAGNIAVTAAGVNLEQLQQVCGVCGAECAQGCVHRVQARPQCSQL